jgi:hypothetical protein
MPLAAGLIIAGAGALVKTGVGLFGAHAAESELAKTKRPAYPIPKQWFDNVDIAGSQAQHGLTEPALNYYSDEAHRGLSSGLGTILSAGGNPNSVAGLYDAYDNGVSRIAAEDAQLKNQNIKGFIDANSNLANEYDKQWTLNEYEPYKDKVKGLNQKISADKQTAWNGVTDLVNTASAAAVAGNYGADSAGKTMGEINGNTDLSVSAAPAPQIPSSDTLINSLGTSGGRDALRSMVANNPNSPYLQGLLRKLSQAQN